MHKLKYFIFILHHNISPQHLFSGLNEKLDLECQNSISIYIHWWLKVITIFNIFEIILLCSPRLHLIGQACSKTIL